MIRLQNRLHDRSTFYSYNRVKLKKIGLIACIHAGLRIDQEPASLGYLISHMYDHGLNPQKVTVFQGFILAKIRYHIHILFLKSIFSQNYIDLKSVRGYIRERSISNNVLVLFIFYSQAVHVYIVKA